MSMGVVIQEKRKALGLTQEQVAACLHVTTPAVSKWENGVTSPDPALLPQLARLLKTDLNTLFCFTEEMTAAESNAFCREIAEIAQAEGLESAFRAASAKLEEYPHSEALRMSLAMQLDGHMALSGMDDASKAPYEETLLHWYQRLAQSPIEKISNQAKFMLASRYIRMGAYDEAQQMLDSMPEREERIAGMQDKLLLQASVYEKQGRAEQAAKELQYALLMAIQRVQMILNKLVEAELCAQNKEAAKQLAEKSTQMAALFDLWEYSAYTGSLQIAMAEENADDCVVLLKKLLAFAEKPWDITASPLYSRMQAASNLPKMLPLFRCEMEQAAQSGFLSQSEAFQKLLAQCKARES